MPDTYDDFRREPSIPHQCLHFRDDGSRCRATSMHNHYMCYHHRSDDIPTVIANDPFLIASLASRDSIQQAYTDVAARLACNHMDFKRAALIIQALQGAQANLTAIERMVYTPPPANATLQTASAAIPAASCPSRNAAPGPAIPVQAEPASQSSGLPAQDAVISNPAVSPAQYTPYAAEYLRAAWLSASFPRAPLPYGFTEADVQAHVDRIRIAHGLPAAPLEPCVEDILTCPPPDQPPSGPEAHPDTQAEAQAQPQAQANTDTHPDAQAEADAQAQPLDPPAPPNPEPAAQPAASSVQPVAQPCPTRLRRRAAPQLRERHKAPSRRSRSSANRGLTTP